MITLGRKQIKTNPLAHNQTSKPMNIRLFIRNVNVDRIAVLFYRREIERCVRLIILRKTHYDLDLVGVGGLAPMEKATVFGIFEPAKPVFRPKVRRPLRRRRSPHL
jgi:hypothetical protein